MGVLGGRMERRTGADAVAVVVYEMRGDGFRTNRPPRASLLVACARSWPLRKGLCLCCSRMPLLEHLQEVLSLGLRR